MEFPDLGEHCTQSGCNKLDFLPIKCEACTLVYCSEHHFRHNCTQQKDNKVPVCPLCDQPVPITRGVKPDLIVNLHIENQCPSELKKKEVFINRCIVKGCKNKEIVPIVCKDCNNNFCLKHRHPTDHKCKGKHQNFCKRALQASLVSNSVPNTTSLQDGTEFDEALARQLSQSMEGPSEKLTQEEIDFELAKQLQMTSEQSLGSRSTRDRCNVS
ncbi:AN1-type zinc finger protein 2A [Agrilus planipennis]|uniref:AN1-type zinc finger protein 2A n=1 Tax=Agrilus planipennis TaxID=224129 RepID=A0A1W4X526_AGRPL|nr:AN1-type zinc finger protein 2A [Agrilus planipennis]